jgi:aspartyl-tRNA(Asn)/glutamyl-tRNA(Gln) amidotransferase subunit A
MTSSTQELHLQSLSELAATLQSKKASAVEVAQHFLQRVQAGSTGAFLNVNEQATMAQAQASDARLAAGEGGCLEGVPIAHKDVFVTRDFVTTAGSKILANYRSPFDATVVQKLANGVNGQSGAGMVTLGKLNCDEFAMGSGNENSAFHAVRNPWDATRVPGGSSGGSAAAVAARLTPQQQALTLAARFANPPVFAASPASNQPMVVHHATA